MCSQCVRTKKAEFVRGVASVEAESLVASAPATTSSIAPVSTSELAPKAPTPQPQMAAPTG